MTDSLTQHLSNREWIASALSDEIHGPGRFPNWKNDLYGEAISMGFSEGMVLDHQSYFHQRHIQKTTEQEVVKNEPPSKRYGVGTLFPREKQDEEGSDNEVEEEESTLPEDTTPKERDLSQKLKENGEELSDGIHSRDEVETDFTETDSISLARLKRPRSMGVTFAADSNERTDLKFSFTGARYAGINVQVKKKDGPSERFSRKKIWLRIPLTAECTIDISKKGEFKGIPLDIKQEGHPSLKAVRLELDVRIRLMKSKHSHRPDSARRITVTIVNKTEAGKRAKEEEIIFQSRFSIASKSPSSEVFLPLDRIMTSSNAEDRSLALLYRNSHRFAIGHGCSGEWKSEEGSPKALQIIAEPLPYYEVPPVTPNLKYPGNHPKADETFKIQMKELTTARSGWLTPLRELVSYYEDWIKSLEELAETIEEEHSQTAVRHIKEARRCASRMRDGLKLLETEEMAALAFQLTNKAILIQQIAGRSPLRTISYQSRLKKWSSHLVTPSDDHRDAQSCYWRPFQIGFILMNLQALWDGKNPDREIADLIWFPTGGGKTEAYLGTTAFYLIARRLNDPEDKGTGVIMRYTLRLLTSQQFQRAAGLICALESIRKDEESEPMKERRLGTFPFRIGIWVGGGTTPNTHASSLEAFNKTKKTGSREYQHVLLRCPWCGSEMGPKRSAGGHQKYDVHGLWPTGKGQTKKVKIHCPDPKCLFHEKLPVEVVDEGIYEDPPSLVIGTVDKFAMLAWRHEGRSLFGIDDQGHRERMPPGLIIQDELHLITGPLGSMVGLYEGVIEELCTWRSKLDDSIVRPKLVASTATTRASTQQIRDLYAKNDTAIFPPPGLNADDSFFATYDRDETGKVKPGRMYLGILARGYGSTLTVNVRVYSSLLAAAHLVAKDERDPWQTLLVFHNSLRELGAGLTLFGADIPERLYNLRNRWDPDSKRRYLNQVLELTGRLENSEIPNALRALEKQFPRDQGVVDACLASNIIEVGVDVPRLGLMAVSGQPKNTAQYIQATGRIGRNSPGLVATVYDHRKARDLSHFEHFRDYHSRLYAQVEPSSVTPFTVQVLERALHGTFLAWIRNRVAVEAQEDPRDFLPKNSDARQSLQEFANHMHKRIEILFQNDQSSCIQATAVFDRILERRKAEWEAVTAAGGQVLATTWANPDLSHNSNQMPLLRFYGTPCRPDWREYIWETPSSMRGVDAECDAAIVSPQK